MLRNRLSLLPLFSVVYCETKRLPILFTCVCVHRCVTMCEVDRTPLGEEKPRAWICSYQTQQVHSIPPRLGSQSRHCQLLSFSGCTSFLYLILEICYYFPLPKKTPKKLSCFSLFHACVDNMHVPFTSETLKRLWKHHLLKKTALTEEKKYIYRIYTQICISKITWHSCNFLRLEAFNLLHCKSITCDFLWYGLIYWYLP